MDNRRAGPRHKKRGTSKTGGIHSPQKQKHLDRRDFEKIVNFLKASSVPQKAVNIAKACGYQSSRFVNPSLYRMEKEDLVQKTDGKPPLWSLLQTMNVPHFHAEHKFGQTFNQYETADRRSSRIINNKGHIAMNSLRPRSVSNRGKSKNISGRESKHHSSIWPHKEMMSSEGGNNSEFTLPVVQQSGESLVRRAVNDKSIPGTHRVQQLLEHSHEKRLGTYNINRKYLPKDSNDKSESEHDSDLSAGGSCDEDMNESDTQGRVITVNELFHSTKDPAAEETTISSEANDEIYDNDSTEDEDYDLNNRIFDVVSIRDPDSQADLKGLQRNYDKQENYYADYDGYERDQGRKLRVKQTVGNNFLSNNNEELGLKEDYLESDNYSESRISETEADATQKVVDSKLLNILNDIPLKTTMKNFLISELHIADSDLQNLLDICSKKGWIDYSPFGHIRLTEAGVKFISDRQPSIKSNSIIEQGNSLPLYPHQLLQNNSTLKNLKTAEKKQDVSASKIQNGFQILNNTFKCKQLDQWNTLQEVNLQSKKQLPYQSIRIQEQCSESSPPSLMPVREPASHMLSDITSSFSYSLLRDSKIPGPVMKPSYLVGDHPKKMSSLPTTTFLSQQEYSLPKRPPLLSLPDMRIHSRSPSYSPGKITLLPSPGQSLYQMYQPILTQQQDVPTSLQISTESFAALNKNPISAFMEYGQCRHTPARIEVLSQRGPSHKPVFTIAAVLGTRVFPSITSSNKKDGKKDAAEQAIRILIAEGQYNMPVHSSVMRIPEASMTQFDKIAALTHQKFNQLIAKIPESLVGRKVIAGLVMKMGEADTGTVISIGSGNRCITGDKLSLRGHTVNDCHAEIITRRGFMRFLYHQLRSYDPKKEHPLFERSATGKFKIKRSVTFHLYISTAPCGDGALFSPRDIESNNIPLTESCTRHRPTFDTNVQGVLRTKMEGGEGTIPVDSDKPVQTWDGIVRGERLRTMSCSDKICRWNVLGLQGSLLAHFLDPVYVNSITLGYLFDAGHLSRAVCCRLDRGEPPLDRVLPFPYHLNHPVLGRVTACDATRETQKTKSYSINWMIEDEKPEIIDGCLGTCFSGDKTEPAQASRVCKKHMLDHFHQTCRSLGYRELLTLPTYSSAKKMSTTFLKAKEAMIQKFKDTNCGIWLSKPIEEEMFS